MPFCKEPKNLEPRSKGSKTDCFFMQPWCLQSFRLFELV